MKNHSREINKLARQSTKALSVFTIIIKRLTELTEKYKELKLEIDADRELLEIASLELESKIEEDTRLMENFKALLK